MKKKYSGLILLQVLILFKAFSQQTAFIEYNTSDGLAQSQVRAIAQDEAGYLWFGTLGGISQFDGYDFINLTEDEGLPDNEIHCLKKGSKFWVGSTGAFASLERKNIQAVDLPPAFASSRVLDIAEDNSGTLWLALGGEGLLSYKKGTFSIFTVDSGLPDNYVRSLSFDKNGKLWVGTRSGIILIEDNKIVNPPFEFLSNIGASQVRKLSDGSMAVCTFGNGVFIIDGKNYLNLTTELGLPSNDIRCIEESRSGDLWMGSRYGLARWKDNKATLFSENQGLPYSNIKSLFIDNENNLWIGTDGQGVLRRAGDIFTFYTVRDGLTSDLVMDMCRLQDQSLLVGTYDRGLSILKNDSFIDYPYNAEVPQAPIWAVSSTTAGRIFVGTSLGLYTEQNGETTIIRDSDGIPGLRITSILNDGDRIYIGAENGFAVLDTSGQLLKTYGSEERFPGNRVRSFLRSGNNLWLGTEGRLIRFNGKEFDRILALPDKETPIYALVEDSLSNIWVGTSDGLYITSNSSKSLDEVEIAKGYNARNINFLSILRDNTLLIGSNNGVYQFSLDSFHKKEAYTVKHYTPYEGLVGMETNQNAIFEDGEVIWFGTTSGAVRFEPFSKQTLKKPAPALHLTNLELFLQEVDWSKLADSASSSTGLPLAPVLKHNQNYLTFNYSGIHFSNPEKVRYRYKLDGLDEEWLGPTESRSATYAYLPHGNYTFRVESYHLDAPENVSSTSFSFEINPPFYLTPWFYLLVALACISIVYLIYQNRIKKEREKQDNLRLQLQSKLMQLESQSLNSSMNRHFIFNALNSIQYYINMQDRRAANRYLTSFAKLIRKNLDSSQQTSTSLKDELERLELYLELEKMRFQDRFEYEIIVEEGISLENVNIPAMLLQPFLENSIWHGILPLEKQGLVRVTIRRRGKSYEIIVDDNGVGFETSLKSKSEDNRTHVSQGMEITRNRIRLYQNMTGQDYQVQGPSEIKSDTGSVQGTQVIIRIPMTDTRDEAKRMPAILEN